MSDIPVKSNSHRFNRAKALVISILIIVVTAVTSLAAAGYFALPFFWIAFAAQLAVSVFSVYGLDSALLNERMKPQGKDEDRYWKKSYLSKVCLVTEPTGAALNRAGCRGSFRVAPALPLVAILPNRAHPSRLIVLQSLHDFRLSVHDKRPISGNRFIERQSAQNQHTQFLIVFSLD